ncbi:MAG: hypothetical protein AB1546_11440, partial [bacterium]
MKHLILVKIAIIVVLLSATTAYAMMCGMMHGKSQKQHDMKHGEQEEMLKEEAISEEEAVEKTKAFVKNNLVKATVGKTEMIDCPMFGRKVYLTQIKLADGTEGALHLDAADGKPVAVIFGEYQCPVSEEASQLPDPARGKYVCPMRSDNYYS